MKSRIILATIGVAMTGILVWMMSLFGFPPTFLIAWLLLIAAIGVITRQPAGEDDGSWPPEKPLEVFRGSDVSRLAWTINTRTGVVGRNLVRRLEQVLRHRLELRGLDLDDEAHAVRIDALLGQGIRSALRSREVTRDDVIRVLDAIETIPPHLEEK